MIVLTGETRRITDGIAELARGNSPKLFISGVYLQAPISKVIDKTISNLQKDKKLSSSADSFKAKISTGKAENTIENALESAIWVKKNNVETVRLITSFYHMPRSKLLFQKYLPKTTIIYHPISFSQSRFTTLTNTHMLGLVFSEYNKFILTYIWNLTGLETKTALRIQGAL
ncbi:MAG: YdcF family protein [Alphaproteobacteria bacterium]|nr:YdcF family protein [Alphaproteobacteria bacterium]